MKLSISDEGFAVLEIFDADGKVITTIPIGFIEFGVEYTFEGVELVP